MRHRTDAVDVVREFGGRLCVTPSRRDSKSRAYFVEGPFRDLVVTRSIAGGLPMTLGEIENDACCGTLELVGKVSIEAPNLPK